MSWVSAAWSWYATNSGTVNPIVAGLGGAALVWAAIRQARTATRRHHEQTRADQQRRLTETFSKAVEQLASDKVEARLGGIYTLERLANEAIAQAGLPHWWRILWLRWRALWILAQFRWAPEWRRRQLLQQTGGPFDPVIVLYWTVMETLTAFVRERTRLEAERLATPLDQRIAERAYLLWKSAGAPEGRSDEFWSAAVKEEIRRERPATDIAAVLVVILRRPAIGRTLEEQVEWRFDLRTTDLRGANLHEAHLKGVDLSQVHLEGADLRAADLKGANLSRAHLYRADLRWASLDNANLSGAHFSEALLDGVNLHTAYGDAATRLPDGVARPVFWPAYDPNAR
jgi:hypothetical protein